MLGKPNILLVNDLDELTPNGTPRAPYRAMNHRFNSFSLSSSLRFALPALIGLIMSAGVAEAQRPVPATPRVQQSQQSQGREQIVPPGFYPPAGMCRIWINQVPAAQQPAPTDCASAVRNRPTNGKVLFGDEPPKSKKSKSDKGKSSPAEDLVDLLTRRISR